MAGENVPCSLDPIRASKNSWHLQAFRDLLDFDFVDIFGLTESFADADVNLGKSVGGFDSVDI